MACQLGTEEGLEGQGGQAARLLGVTPELIAEILELERVVRDCCGPFGAAEDNGVRAQGEDEEAGGRLSSGPWSWGPEGFRIWGGGLAEASYAGDTPPGLWTIGWVAIETWCGMELCVVCAGENELMWSWEDQGSESSLRIQVPGGELGGKEGRECTAATGSHRLCPLWPAVSLTYN